MKLEFQLNARNGFIRQEISRVFGGVLIRFGLVTFLVEFLDAAQQLGFFTLQFGRCKTVFLDPRGFGQQSVQTGFDAVVFDRCTQNVKFLRTNEPSFTGKSEQKRWLGAFQKLAQAIIEHAIVKRFEQKLSIPSCRSLLADIVLVIDAYVGSRCLHIRSDGKQRLFMRRHRVHLTLWNIVLRFEMEKMLSNKFFYPRFVKVTHHNDCHEIRTIPVFVKLNDGLVRSVFDDLFLSDGQPFGVSRIFEKNGELLVTYAGAGPSPESPFFDHHAAFLINFSRLKTNVVGPIFENLKRGLNGFHAVSGHLQHINGFIEARVCVDIRPKSHADGFEIVHDFLLCEILCAIESHVFYEMG